jgi:hypothetical protein
MSRVSSNNNVNGNVLVISKRPSVYKLHGLKERVIM